MPCLYNIFDSGPMDPFILSNDNSSFRRLLNYHVEICNCNDFHKCVKTYRRCLVSKSMYHSLQYTKRKSTISYFVKYLFRSNVFEFGVIEVFFEYQQRTYALVNRFQVVNAFSDYLKKSRYYELLKQPLDNIFFVLEKTNDNRIVLAEKIEKHMIIFENIPEVGFISATPMSSTTEHD